MIPRRPVGSRLPENRFGARPGLGNAKAVVREDVLLPGALARPKWLVEIDSTAVIPG
jgi:hypothetical protein